MRSPAPMFSLTKIITLALSLLLPSSLWAECADWQDRELRKLHSKDSVDLCTLTEGKPLLVINTASFCGYTGQFAGLEALHQQYKDKGLVVLGFPSNDFRQESAKEAETAKVCYVNYRVSFTMFSPVAVRGEEADKLFKYLAAKSSAPSWNFNKFLVSADGQTVQHFSSGVAPDSATLTQAIERELAL